MHGGGGMLQPLSFIAHTSLYVVMCVKINESLLPPPLLPLSLSVYILLSGRLC